MAPTRTLRAAGALLITILLLATNAFPAQHGTTRRVRFPRGRTSTILRGAVVRGTVDRYILGAGAGQTMTVHVTSTEDNAVFTIYGRGGASLIEESMDWSGVLPASGDYVIEVGGTRGNATYTLEVSIR